MRTRDVMLLMRLGVPVAAVLPDDARGAALLSDGAGGQRTFTSGALLRSARVAGKALREHIAVVTPPSSDCGCTPVTLQWPPALPAHM